MGTSQKKVKAKIKQILAEANEENIISHIPKALSVTNIDDYFPISQVSIAIGFGLSSAKDISSGNFGQFGIPDNFDVHENKDKISEKILDYVRDLNPEVEFNDFVLIAFKLTITHCILNKDVDDLEFTRLFCKNLLLRILQSECQEALTAQFKSEPEKIDTMLEEAAISVFDDELEQAIQNLVAGELNVEQLVEEVKLALARKSESEDV